MNILILSGRFGMGHNSAAKAIAEELVRIDNDIKVNTVDLIEYLHPNVSEYVYKGFNKVVNKYPEIYNMIYKASEKIEIDMKLSGSKINRKITTLLNMYKPDIIISTIPICARTISSYKENKNIDIPLITCITDISYHHEWMAENTDIYLVPTKEVKEHLINEGINNDRIFTVGIPVKQAFKNLENHKEDSSEKNILIMGGGLGLLPDLDLIMEELDKIPNLTTTIITGTNKTAYDNLQGKYENAEIVGFTDRVSEYMGKADFMISKAGGITLFESIYSETPMFVIKPFLAQEKKNAEFIEENLIGNVIWEDNEDFVNSIIELIDNEMKLNSMKDNMKELRNQVLENKLIEVIDYIKTGVLKNENINNYNFDFVI